MKLVVFSLAAALAAITACTDASAPTELDSQPQFSLLQGGCATPFQLIGVEAPPAVPAGQDPIVDPAVEADRNGDSIVCILVDAHDPSLIHAWVDNNVPLSQVGGCPGAFVLMKAPAVKLGDPTVDDNLDGLACSKTTNSGGTIWIDNRHRN